MLLSRHGQTFLRAGYGRANEEWEFRNSPTTKFRIGSVTKTFTAAAILKLCEAAILTLDGRIGQWIGGVPEAWRHLTLHQLLTHTAGLRDHIGAPGKQAMNLTGARPAELIALIAKEPFLSPPGTTRSYSNTGYILLGMLIEAVTNQSYAEFMEETIFRPLKLSSTGYDSHAKILPERASGYTRLNGILQNASYLDMTVPFAAGGLYSTIDDLQSWNTALHVNGFLKPASYNQMIAEYPETEGPDGFYGYGLFIANKSDRRCLSHSGGVNGFMSVVDYYPEQGASLILLTNIFPVPFQPSTIRCQTGLPKR